MSFPDTKTDNYDWLVCVRSFTFNHKPYIRDAMNGFTIQQTNFPYVCCIVDDASTDGAQNVILEYISENFDLSDKTYSYTEDKDYGKLIFARHKTNLNCFFVVLLLKENHHASPDLKSKKRSYISKWEFSSKYEAVCEGDDYWIDPLKLQKQVDYLEEHPDCSLVCSNYDIFLQKEQKIHMSDRKSGKISFNDILRHNYVATLTAVIPISVLIEYLEFSKDAPKWSFGDYPIWIFAATKGYIMRLLDTTAVYRILENSASHMTNDSDRLKWAYSEFSMVDYFEARLNIPNSIRQRVWFKRIQIFTPLAISTKNHYLISRISNYYRDNHFYIAWLSFLTMVKFPKFSWLPRIIDSHIFLKAPILYIRGKFVRNNF